VPALGVLSNARAPRLEQWLRTVRPDVVHVHSGTWLKTAHAARRAGVPRVVHTAHGLLDREPWHGMLLKRLAGRYTDHVVAVSSALQREIARQISRPAEGVELIPNGIDTSRFQPGARAGTLRERLGIADDAKVIGNVARLQDVKNHALLLEAFAPLARRIPDSHLVIVGEGPLRQELLDRAVKLGIADRVHLIGAEDDTAPLYRQFDLYVLPSKAEGTSMSLLEAMASGIPVVASAVGGTPDLLAHGARGRLVPSGDAAALEQGMFEALTDPSAARVAGVARHDVVREYSERAMVTAYERLYGVPRGAAIGETTAAEVVACVE
jgi:glycosyltransferase involved in cell wall biosynthesis